MGTVRILVSTPSKLMFTSNLNDLILVYRGSIFFLNAVHIHTCTCTCPHVPVGSSLQSAKPSSLLPTAVHCPSQKPSIFFCGTSHPSTTTTPIHKCLSPLIYPLTGHRPSLSVTGCHRQTHSSLCPLLVAPH